MSANSRERRQFGRRAIFMRLMAISALFVTAPLSRIALADEKEIPWEQIDDSDGIVVHRREVPGSPIIAFKGAGIINAPLVRVASVLVDSSRATEWVDKLAEVRRIRPISKTAYINYSHVSTPFVMKDRDFVTYNEIIFDLPNKRVSVDIHSVDDPEAPKTSYIRGRLIKTTFTLTSIEGGTRTHILAEVHADPMGSVPKWIVNMFQKKWPYNTITSLRAQVAKSDVKELPNVRQELESRGFLKP